jgi:hypothetical protein
VFLGQPQLDRGDRVHDRLQRLALPERARPGVRELDLGAVVGHRLLPVEHLAHDRDVVADALVRLAPRLAVPPLDDLRAGHPDADDEPTAAGEGVDRHGVHGQRGRRPGCQLHHRGPELDAVGDRREVRQRRQRVGAVGLGRPHGVVPEGLGPLDGVDRHGEVGGAVQLESESQLHGSEPATF